MARDREQGGHFPTYSLPARATTGFAPLLGVKLVIDALPRPHEAPTELSPQELQACELLLAPTHPSVYFLLSNGERLDLTPRQTIARLKHGGYEVKLRAKRVRYIRIASKPAVWSQCWRNTGAAVLWETTWGHQETADA